MTTKKEWFKQLTDKEIFTVFYCLSDKAIQSMKMHNVKQSINFMNELESLSQELIEYICSFRGFYYGSAIYQYYDMVIDDIRELNSFTDNTMIKIFNDNRLNN